MPVEAYPKRVPFFCCKFVRRLGDAAVPVQLGADVAFLLSYIAAMEDGVGYRPVAFFNEDLARRTGLSLAGMKRARDKAVKAGWLSYTRGAKGRAAVYFVLVPRWAEIPDNPAGGTQPPADAGQILAQPEPESDQKADSIADTGSLGASIRSECEPPSSLSLSLRHSQKESVGADAPPATSTATKAKRKKSRARKQPAEKKPRPRNPLFDAIAEVTGFDPSLKANAALVGVKAAELGAATPPYTPDEVREFGRRFLELCPYARNDRTRPTPGEVGTYISLIRSIPVPKHQPSGIPEHLKNPATATGMVASRLVKGDGK